VVGVGGSKPPSPTTAGRRRRAALKFFLESAISGPPGLVSAAGRFYNPRPCEPRSGECRRPRAGGDSGFLVGRERRARAAVRAGPEPLFVFSGKEGFRIAAPKRIRRNEEIEAPRVRVIGSDGKQLGVMSREEALEIARDADLDLVEVSPTADPPVCRVMDFGKYLFELNKKAQSARRKQKQVHVKEIKFRPGTDEGDYRIKLRKLMEFLESGDKTKVTLRFRGREMAHQEIGA